jgi:hypothetical protein
VDGPRNNFGTTSHEEAEATSDFGGPIVYPVFLNEESGTGSAALEIDVRIAACGDGVDNDGDGHTDFPADPQCSSYAHGNESPPRRCGLLGLEIAALWPLLRRSSSSIAGAGGREPNPA